jgi:hypothetical protein
MKKITLFLALIICLSSISCGINTSSKEVKDDPAVFFADLQNTVDEMAKKVLVNDYVGAKTLLASQKAILQSKCKSVKSSGGSYPHQLTIKTVTAKATLEDAIARSTGAVDVDNADNSKINEQRELMKEFNEICSP